MLHKANPEEETCGEEGCSIGVPRHQFVGVDGEGFAHHLDRTTMRVHRVSVTGERERVTDVVSQSGVEAYVHDFVAVQVGWEDRIWTNRDVFGSDK